MRIAGAGHWFRPQRWLFRDLSFVLEPGQVTAILGPNGCGKTTLLRALCGILQLREGQVVSDGIVGHVPQALVPDTAYSALEMVLLGRSRHIGRFGVPGRLDMQRAHACLDEVGLLDLASKRFDRLSGGQRQLVLFARALASDCQVLVLDEPASALDLANQGAVLRLIARLASDRGLAVMFTTHDPDHVLAVADAVLMFVGEEGPVHGPVREIATDENLSRMYGIPIRRLLLEADGRSIETIVPLHRIDAKVGTARREATGLGDVR